MTVAWDVVVAGGGLAGACLGLQLRRELPSLRVAVIERAARPLPEACHKVGESTVELATHYFEHGLGLGPHLRAHHLLKNGLRFFPGGGDLPLAERVEIGPPELPVVPSYQIDRGRLENHLRSELERAGVSLIEGVSVRDVRLSGDRAPHRVCLSDGRAFLAHWLVDATGRRRFLARKLGLEADNHHRAAAAWFRVRGRLDVASLVDEGCADWHRRDGEGIRWLSTNHLMGEGYWVWLIPLASGFTSIGIVAHDACHPVRSFASAPRAAAWLAEHEPALARALEGREKADFVVLRDYSHTTRRAFSEARWAMVGEAAAFVDPLYSPGSDFIALANSFVTEIVRAWYTGADYRERAESYDHFFRRFTDAVSESFRHAAPVYGRPEPMAAKIYWDNFNYWSFPCQFFIQRIYAEGRSVQQPFLELAACFQAKNRGVQRLLAAWAQRSRPMTAGQGRHQTMPAIPSKLTNLHLALAQPQKPHVALDVLRTRAEEADDIVADLVVRAAAAVGPEAADDLMRHVPFLARERVERRIEAELGSRRTRRRRLPTMARDMERTLGAISLHADWSSFGRMGGWLRAASA